MQTPISTKSKPPKPTTTTLTTTKPQTVKSGAFQKVIRGPFFLIGFAFLFISTSLVFISLFTNNWQKTAPSLSTSGEYYTNGLWFTCRNLRISWQAVDFSNTYCFTSNYSIVPWIYAVQVFYTMGAGFILLALLTSLLGICRDCARNKLGMPSFLFWIILVSSIFQLVGISVFGGKGIADYSSYVPDYSIIIAGIGLGFSTISAVMFIVEMLCYSKYDMKTT